MFRLAAAYLVHWSSVKFLAVCLLAWLGCGVLVASANLASDRDEVVASNESREMPRLVSLETHQRSRAALPRVADDELQEILEGQELIFYSEAEMPRAFPKWNGSLAGVHSAYYNISAGAGEPFGNGNREFPWSGAAGTHRAAGFQTLHFVALPRDEQGRILPVIYQTHAASAGGLGKVTWRYPHGTVFGECLLIEFQDGSRLPCELRIRRRVEGDWEVDLFRPFPTARSLAERIPAVRPLWADDPQLSELVSHLQDAEQMQRATLTDDHPRKTFDQVAGMDSLPYMDPELVKVLLKTTVFQSCLGMVWKRSAEGLDCHAPTSEFREQIVPQRYDGGFVRANTRSCLRCHATVGQNVARFDAGRDWYGDIRGSDGIFSFHPFDRSAISFNGISTPVRIRQDLVDRGIVAHQDTQSHNERHYSVFQIE